MHSPTAPTDVDSRTNALASPAGSRVRPPPSPSPVQAGAAGGREGGSPLVISPTEPPPHANAGIRRSRTDPALHAADARPAAQLVMFLSARRQRPWPLFCLCAGCSTPPDAHGAGFGGGHPSGVLQCAGVWPASVTARAVTPAPSRGSQHFRPDSRYGNATGSTLSALSRRTTVQPYNPKTLALARHRR